MGKFFKGVVKFSVAAAAVGGLCYAFKDKIRESKVYQDNNVDEKINKVKTTIKDKMPKIFDNEDDIEEDDLFADDSICMAGLRTKTLGIYEKDTGRSIHCNIEGYPYILIWSAAAKPVRFVCIEPWQSLPAAETDPQAWEQRAAAACLAPGESWQTTLSTTFDR